MDFTNEEHEVNAERDALKMMADQAGHLSKHVQSELPDDSFKQLSEIVQQLANSQSSMVSRIGALEKATTQ